jgi:sugar phosphate isomerase/epimerase
MKPISLQLYTLRELAGDIGYEAMLEKVAAIGYKGVEFAGFYDQKPADLKKRVEDLGMTVSSSHGPWVSPDNVSEAADTVKTLGLDIACAGWGPDQYRDMDAVKETAERINTIIDGLSSSGISLFLHNHYWEFNTIDGKLAYDWIAEMCPEVQFEIDVYWAANFGACDPAAEVAKFASRAPLLHIKDGPLEKEAAMTAVGTGKVDIPAVINAADDSVLRWLVVELDRCDTDMLTAVQESYAYLTGEGLALGNK